MNTEIPKPSECETRKGSFIATFGKSELEEVAWHLTVASQKNADCWLTNFTVREFCKLTGWSLRYASDALYWLDMLAERGWLDKKTTRQRSWIFFSKEVPQFSINEHFANKVYKAQARNRRIWDPNTPTDEEDIMRAIGLLPD